MAMTIDPRGKSMRTGFPEKTNPNRPVPAASGPGRETPGDARSFSERCDPRHSHRPLTDEQRKLVTRYMPLARALVRRAARKLVEVARDELQAEANVALVDAAKTFDPDLGVNFAVHARGRICWALLDYTHFLNRKCKRRESPVFKRLRKIDDLHGRVVGKAPEEPPGKELEEFDAVESIIRLLPRSHADACRLLYIEGKSYGETAKALGCTTGYVSRLHGDALERLRHDYREALAG
jgi:RNA polymerase sigma factor (sigma-70 family)